MKLYVSLPICGPRGHVLGVIENWAAFLSNQTIIVVHVAVRSETTRKSVSKFIRKRGFHNVIINAHQIDTVRHTGTIFLAHLSNIRFAIAHSNNAKDTTFLLGNGTYLFIKRGIEARIEKLRIGYGRTYPMKPGHGWFWKKKVVNTLIAPCNWRTHWTKECKMNFPYPLYRMIPGVGCFFPLEVFRDFEQFLAKMGVTEKICREARAPIEELLIPTFFCGVKNYKSNTSLFLNPSSQRKKKKNSKKIMKRNIGFQHEKQVRKLQQKKNVFAVKRITPDSEAHHYIKSLQ